MAPVGVQITTSVRTGTSNPGVATGRFHVAGVTERGPVSGARIVHSLAQFESVYGGRTPYNSALYDTARMFWEEGGDELAVSRVVGPAASAGSLSLDDTDAVPVPTLQINAVNPGPASTTITVEVVSSINDSFTIVVRVNGKVVTRASGLKSPAEAVAAFSSHQYIRVSDLGSATAAPANNPAFTGELPLSPGFDDRESIVTTSYIEALARAGEELAGSAVAVPGQNADTMGPALIAHAKQYEKVALLSLAPGTTVDEALATSMEPLRANGDYGALLFPNVVIPDGNGTRVVGPEGYAAAARNRAHAAVGFWQAPPGDNSLARWIISTDVPVTVSENNELNEYGINGIVTMGNKPRLYGWSSLSSDRDNLAMLSNRDTLNTLSSKIRSGLEAFVFETIDAKGQLLGRIESACVGILGPVAEANGFYARIDDEGEETDPGYSVRVDSTLNTIPSLSQNEVRVSIAVRLSPMANLISVEIIKVPLSAAV